MNAEKAKNIMRQPHIDKVVVNIGVGEAGDKLTKAEKVIEMITKHKPVRTHAKITNKDLGVRFGMPIGVKVTLRGKAAQEFLKTALWTRENKLYMWSFDNDANFAFGIQEYTDFPGMKYDPNIGIFGMDICVTMIRQGFRIRNRRKEQKKIPKNNRLTEDEVRDYLTKAFSVEFFE
jgi:large subunit ribosomal protein L5